MGIFKTIREAFRKFLRINDNVNLGVTIDRKMNYETNAAKNTIWYSGDSYELAQLYDQIYNSNQSFWGAQQTKGQELRKIHCGLPKLIVDTLTNVTLSDLDDISFEDETNKELFDTIADENNFTKLLRSATKQVLVKGDGAFKISFSQRLSSYPIIEFYSGEDVFYSYDRGRLSEIHFLNKTKDNANREITLEEVYGFGYVRYALYVDGTQRPLDYCPEYAGLEDVTFDDDIILGIPYKIFDSEMYVGRGASIYDGKCDAFDALDEVISEWTDAIRMGRVKTYIPDCLIPRDENNGMLLKPNAFDQRFIRIDSPISPDGGTSGEIITKQPDINTEPFLQTYMTFLDMCLQGIISPSTLGIDVKKLDNAESQREKEKTTMYTRQAIITELRDVLQQLVQTVFDAYSIQCGISRQEVVCDVDFGEYANPSFEAVVETMSNPNTPMSVEAKVDELWGNSKTEEWKREEVARIKAERGIMTAEEPAVNEDYMHEENNGEEDIIDIGADTAAEDAAEQ